MAKKPTELRSKHAIDLGADEFRAMHRTFTVEREGIDKEARTVEMSFASETPVDRWFGREILDITDKSVDLTRLNSGGALLLNHEWDEQVGVVTKAYIDGATKKARAVVKFSRSECGEEIFQDVIDGIRSLVSVGYVVRKMVLASVEGDVETHRVTDWLPFEISIVSVPADNSVGIGRSQSKETTKPAVAPAPAIITSRQMPTEQDLKPAPTAAEGAAAERSRVTELNKTADGLASRHPKHKDAFMALARKCVETGDNVDAFNRSVLADILKTGDNLTPATQQRGDGLELPAKDIRRYSVLRAIRAKMNGGPLDGLERECSDEIAKKLERQPTGFFLPDAVVADTYQKRIMSQGSEKRTLLAGNAVDGGYTVASEILTSEFMKLLRNNTRVVDLGARFISGLTGDVSIPRQLTGASVAWVSETGSISSSSATFGQVVGKPRRVGSSVPYSKQFLAQSSLDAEAFVVEDSDMAMAVELDRVAIDGTGGSQPLGILNLSSGDLGGTVTFSGAPTWAKYLEFFSDLATANSLLGTPGYLSTPASAAKAMSIPKFSNTATPIWDNDRVGAFRALWSTNFPSGDKVIFGDFSQVLFLEWAGRDVIVDPYGTNATSGTVTVTIQRLIDMVIRRSASFDISTDSGAQ